MIAPDPGSAPDVRAGARDFERAASRAAHEMSGPLATIAAAMELLRTRLDPSDAMADELADTVVRHVRLAQLQTTQLGRLSLGPTEPEREPTDLAMLAEEVVADLSMTELAEHPTDVVVHRPARAWVDPDQIRQALYNLLTNAARYSPKGHAVVVELAGDDDRIELRVRDQGHGVAPESTERIFEPYERECDAAPGLGLGLPLSREIARRHGGELSLEPAPEDGSVFLLTLPRPELA